MDRPSPHHSKRTDASVVILKSPPFGSDVPGAKLPYRIDLLCESHLRPVWTDRHLSGIWARIAAATERWTVPWTQAFLTRNARRGAVATVAMFESEGHGLALFRRLTRRRKPPLIIISCWLADLVRLGGWRSRLYRWIYWSVDAVVVFSSNQRRTLIDLLGVDPDRVVFVRFGVDLEELTPIGTEDAGRVVAAGRDLSRDWPTFLEAIRGTGWPTDLITRARQLSGLDVPTEVTVHGTLERQRYLDVLAKASVVVIPTDVREYPAGQTVLLEAMALGKACVVTDTPALREYVHDQVDGVLVPPGDSRALRAAIAQLLSDPEERSRLGSSAQEASAASGGASAMWGEIATVVRGVQSRGS